MNKFDSFLFGVLAGAILFVIIWVIINLINPIPTALDVYQGKTTLEITYKDGIPVDSVVVWKEEFKK